MCIRDRIIAEDSISNVHLRMLVDKIRIGETTNGLKLEVQLKVAFQSHLDKYDEAGGLLESVDVPDAVAG